MTFTIYSVANKGVVREIKHKTFWKKDIVDYKISNDAHFLAIYTALLVYMGCPQRASRQNSRQSWTGGR